jgi:site-specific DNA-methyltransferase (adenine-specific)
MIELEGATVYLGSNLDVLPTLPDNSVDSIVTDPPYELGFMGKSWDNSGIAYSVELWTECMRVLKPGGHLLAFGGSRTWHRLAVAIQDAGFEMRDSIAWLYGSGFPKSHNISIGIDKAAGAMQHRGVRFENSGLRRQGDDVPNPTGAPAHEPVTPEALKWQGWGTALKPAFEPIVVARKPLIGTVAANVLEWGTGGLNIDASRIGTEQVTINTFDNGAKPFGDAVGEPFTSRHSVGRWPANIILDPYTAELLDEQNDASRFFYIVKANKRDRNEGLEGFREVQTIGGGRLIAEMREDGSFETASAGGKYGSIKAKQTNFHPTVKPTALMEYLIKLVTPEGGTVLDPFTGSGSTGKAALLNGFNFIGIELTEEYLPIIEGRLKWAINQTKIDKGESLF